MTTQSISSMAPSASVVIQRSPWHSPVPYLFGGLAAMLGLIAFALLILACSYWKISPARERDLEAGEGDIEEDSKPVNHQNPPVFEEKYLVIMAGQANPTFLATPASSRTSSFGSCSCQSNTTVSTETLAVSDEEKQGSFDQVQVTSTDNHETANQLP
ncbi:glutamine dumper 3 [Artemisia annua]|uniref:Glutamine dumper 3 n=1 Tax=Artemisia annua TaxID=35608 RepID=A0A2U1N920_ARTAN|nr:glutamine dumper 3 [Artemisia annua]